MEEELPQETKQSPASHPIAVVSDRTGLSRHVLRVWERRFGAVKPVRSPRGQRLYNDQQVARFRLLAAATKNGRGISQVAHLNDDALAQLVAEDEVARPTEPDNSPSLRDSTRHETIERALDMTRALNGAGLDASLRRAIAHHGFPAFLESIAPTFMYRVGEEWNGRRLSIAHEHLASAAVLAIILEGLHMIPKPEGAPRLLVATPSGERHAVGAALTAVTAALDGWSVVHLGVDVPAADLVAAAAATRSHAVALSLVHSDNPDATQRELHAVRAALPNGVPLFLGGAALDAIPSLKSSAGIHTCASVTEFRTALARLRTVA